MYSVMHVLQVANSDKLNCRSTFLLPLALASMYQVFFLILGGMKKIFPYSDTQITADAADITLTLIRMCTQLH